MGARLEHKLNLDGNLNNAIDKHKKTKRLSF